MKPKRITRITVDALMLFIMLLQMSYSIAGELLHEILGISLFALFVLHHILSFNFSRALVKSRKTPEKIMKTAVDILLTADILIMMFSAVVVSKHLFKFLGITTLSDFGRTAHLLGSYWGFALMCIHLGFHLDFLFHGVMKNKQKKKAFTAVMLLLAAAGLIIFIRDGIYKYMLLINRFVFFDTAGGLPLFLLKYALVAAMFTCAGYTASRAVKAAGRRNNEYDNYGNSRKLFTHYFSFLPL